MTIIYATNKGVKVRDSVSILNIPRAIIKKLLTNVIIVRVLLFMFSLLKELVNIFRLPPHHFPSNDRSQQYSTLVSF